MTAIVISYVVCTKLQSIFWRHFGQVIGAVKFPLHACSNTYSRNASLTPRSVRIYCVPFQYDCPDLCVQIEVRSFGQVTHLTNLFSDSTTSFFPFWMCCPFLIPNFDRLLSLINTVQNNNNNTNLNILLRNENYFAAPSLWVATNNYVVPNVSNKGKKFCGCIYIKYSRKYTYTDNHC